MRIASQPIAIPHGDPSVRPATSSVTVQSGANRAVDSYTRQARSATVIEAEYVDDVLYSVPTSHVAIETAFVSHAGADSSSSSTDNRLLSGYHRQPATTPLPGTYLDVFA